MLVGAGWYLEVFQNRKKYEKQKSFVKFLNWNDKSCEIKAATVLGDYDLITKGLGLN